MDRRDIINHLIEKHKYSEYLNLGVFTGYTLDGINCENKVGVDPQPEHYKGDCFVFRGTSDEYFQQLNENKKFDICFIDGMHKSEFVDRDIQNCLKHLKVGGTIVLHDVNPSSYEMTTSGTVNGEWTGDVYKSAIGLKFSFADGDFYVVDTDYGVGVARPTKPLPFKSTWVGTWKDFDKNREFLLNLISVEEFLQREKINE